MTSSNTFREPDSEAADDKRPRREAFDVALKAALHDVPVPSDLADRLLARIGAAPVLQRSTGETPVPPGQSTGGTPVSPRRIRFSRRRVLMGAGSLALVALIALSVVY